jgi:hypothetical protein
LTAPGDDRVRSVELTDLSVLVGEERHVAARIGIAAQHDSWLALLPGTVVLNATGRLAGGVGRSRHAVLPDRSS